MDLYQKIKERFSYFETLKLFYSFYLKTINWLCANFFNEQVCEIGVCYENKYECLNNHDTEKICWPYNLLLKVNEIMQNNNFSDRKKLMNF